MNRKKGKPNNINSVFLSITIRTKFQTKMIQNFRQKNLLPFFSHSACPLNAEQGCGRPENTGSEKKLIQPWFKHKLLLQGGNKKRTSKKIILKSVFFGSP